MGGALGVRHVAVTVTCGSDVRIPLPVWTGEVAPVARSGARNRAEAEVEWFHEEYRFV
jgi:hypothetical protein